MNPTNDRPRVSPPRSKTRGGRSEIERKAVEDFHYEAVARELVRALRGRRSCADVSRRAGYRSNVVHRWEAGECWPTMSRFLSLHGALRPRSKSWIERFFNMSPGWASDLDPVSPAAVAAFLQRLRGKTPLQNIAAITSYNRYSVSRWLSGVTEPKIPEFLRLVDAMSRRLLDLICALEDPERLPSIRQAWEQHQLAEKAAYELPWSHGILRALELTGAPSSPPAQEQWIAEMLGIDLEQVRAAISLLLQTKQIRRSVTGYRPRATLAVDTSRNPERAYELKLSWTRTALTRMEARVPGHYGYSLFAVSKADMTRLRDVHLQYYRAMQDIIAGSKDNECVGLYCAQLVDLGAPAPAAPPAPARPGRRGS